MSDDDAERPPRAADPAARFRSARPRDLSPLRAQPGATPAAPSRARSRRGPQGTPARPTPPAPGRDGHRHRAPVPAVVAPPDPAAAPLAAHRARRPAGTWPGDPLSAWEGAARDPIAPLERPRPHPPLRTVQDAAAHMSPRIPGYRSRAQLLAASGIAVVVLAGVVPVHSRGGAALGAPTVQIAALVLGVLLVLAGLAAWIIGRRIFEQRLEAESARALREGVLCDVLALPSQAGTAAPRILLEASLAAQRAARIRAALAAYAATAEGERAWDAGPLPRSVLTSAELFGPQAAGGYLVRSAEVAPGSWALLLPAPAPLDPAAPHGDAAVVPVTDPPQGSAWDRL